ncbi:AfsR/SARP family transcriptional regulator [Actinokineospora sp. 24-640]
MRVEVLGPVRLVVAGGGVRVGPPRQRAVLGVLAAAEGRVVPRARIRTALWGASAPPSADGSVHTYICGLRRCLGAHAHLLATTGSGYTLAVEPGALDAVRFARTCAEAATRSDPETVLRLLSPALDLWRGAPYAGIPGPFADAERSRLTALHHQARLHHAQALSAVGDHVRAIADLRALAAADPLHEGTRAALVTALRRAGHRADALTAYHAARRDLHADLGVPPGPDLRAALTRTLADTRPFLVRARPVPTSDHATTAEPSAAPGAPAAARATTADPLTTTGPRAAVDPLAATELSAVSPPPPPSEVDELLACLPRATRDILRWVALMDRPTRAGLVRVAGRVTALGDALAAGILVERPVLAFRDDAVREAVLADLAPPLLNALRREVGRRQSRPSRRA